MAHQRILYGGGYIESAAKNLDRLLKKPEKKMEHSADEIAIILQSQKKIQNEIQDLKNILLDLYDKPLPQKEAAKFLGMSMPTFQRKKSDGTIKTVQIGGRVFATKKELLRVLETGVINRKVLKSKK